MEQHLGYQEIESPAGWEQEQEVARLLAVLDDVSLAPGLADVSLGGSAVGLPDDVSGGTPRQVDALLNAQVVRVGQMLHASLCALYLADPLPVYDGLGQVTPAASPELAVLRLRALHGVPSGDAVLHCNVVVPPHGPIRQAFLSQQVLASEQAGLPALYQEAVTRNVRRWLYVPLVVSPALLPPPAPMRTRPLSQADPVLEQAPAGTGWSLGVLAVGRRIQAPDFSEHDLRLFRLLADQIALALEHLELAGRLGLARLLGQRYQALAGASAELEQMMEHLSEGVLLLLPDGQVARLNAAGRQLLSFSTLTGTSRARTGHLQQFLQTRWSGTSGELLPQEQWPLMRALRGEHFQEVVVRYACPGASERLLVFSGRPLYDAQGHLESALLNFHLASDEQQARAHLELLARLADQRAHYILSVLEAVTDGVLVCDSQGAIFLINPAGRKLLGLPASHPGFLLDFLAPLQVRRPNGELLASQDFPLARALLGETVRDMELLLRQPTTGNEWFARVSAAPIRDRTEQGPIVGAVCGLVDVTQARALEHAKDEFLAVAAHELKGPLTSIRGFAQLLRRGARHAPQGQERRGDMHWVEKIEGQTERMARLVAELTDAARADMGRFDLRRRPVALGALLRRVAEAQQVTTEQQRILLDVPSLLLFVLGDEARLEQVFTNLVANAIKYSPGEGEIKITVVVVEAGQYARSGAELAAEPSASPMAYVEVRVQDEGQGIAAADLERIFRRFARADAERDKTQGLGLGLYIARAIIQAHGGTITVESPGIGQGTTFIVRLPRLDWS
jgi:signal transduction histidine kinase/GAF domain-containing protein